MDVPTSLPTGPPEVAPVTGGAEFQADVRSGEASLGSVTPSGAAQPTVGQLTVAWQVLVGVTWAAVFFAFAATWKASEEIGIATWWLGPRAQPEPLVINLIPFALSVLVGLTAIYNVRHVALISIVGSAAVALIAVFDISRSGGLAAIEFAIAGSAMFASLGALSGTYRRSRVGSNPAAEPGPSEPGPSEPGRAT